MPQLKWEWNFGPQTLLSSLNLIVLLTGFIGVWWEMRTDVTAAKEKAVQVEIKAEALRRDQQVMAEKVVRVETKIDLLMPAIDRIEARQVRGTSPY